MSAVSAQPAKKGGFKQKLKHLLNLDGSEPGYPEHMDEVKRDAEARKAAHAPHDTTTTGSVVPAGCVPTAGGYGGAGHGGDGGGAGRNVEHWDLDLNGIAVAVSATSYKIDAIGDAPIDVPPTKVAVGICKGQYDGYKV